MGIKTYKDISSMQNPGGQRTGKAGGGRVKKQRGSSVETMGSGRPIQWQQGEVGQRRKRDYMNYVAPKAAKRQLAKQPPGRKAASIGPGGWSAGGKVSKATGGRVKKQAGSVTSVRGRGGPNVRPNVNVLGVEAARAHQAVRRANPPKGTPRGTPQQETITGRGGITGSTRTAPAPGTAPRRPPPDVRPGYAKGSKAKSKKGKKSTKKAPKKSIFEQITRPGSPSRKAASKGGKAKR
jgi:hypothetical protein